MNLKNIFNQGFLNKLLEDDLLDMSSSLSYYTALSLSPLLILLVTFVAFMGDNFKVELVRQIQDLVGSQAAEAIHMITENADRRESLRNLAGLLGLLTLLLSASAIFQKLRKSLNTIFAVEENTNASAEEPSVWQATLGFLQGRIFNMGMVLTFVFISIVSLAISSALSLWLEGAQLIFGQLVNFLISVLIFAILFSSLYYFLPQRRLPRRIALTSGVLTSVFFSIGKSLIGIYLGQSAVASAYGAAGSLVVLLMWVYYSSLIIFLSAEFSYQLHQSSDTNRPAQKK